jgi:hypothetical protein
MNVQIDIHQDRTVEPGPLFRVATYVVYTYGIDPNIFVFNIDTDEFSHVATVWDMVNVESDRIIAQNNLDPFYRKDSAIVDYVNQVTADAAAQYTAERVGFLAQQYDLMNSEFVGESDYSFVEP